MTHETLPANPETMHLSSEATMFMGFAAVEEPKINLRTEVIDGYTVHTNLPEGVLPFEPPAANEAPSHPFYRRLLPSALDRLPPGEFKISNPNSPDDFYGRTITVTEEADGKRINFIGTGLIKNAGNNEQLMQALGYTADTVPMPQTIKNKAAELGVDIKFFADQTLIDNDSYLGAFSDGQYPISTASAEYYMHDTQDGHLTAMVLGGEPLKAALRAAADEALRGNTDADATVQGIDEFTAYLRGAVSQTYDQMDMAYGSEALQTVGQSIGMTPETVTEILATARMNAQKFGMKLNQ